MAVADLNHRLIADTAIGYISNSVFPALKTFSFSLNGQIPRNTTVPVPIIGAGGAAAAFNSSTNNYLTGGTVNTTKVDLKPSTEILSNFDLTPADAHNIGSFEALLKERMIALGNGLANEVFKLITKANFPKGANSVGEYAMGTTTASAVIGARRKLGGATKSVILNGDSTTALLQDISTTGNDRSSFDALVDGRVARISGMDIYESDLFDTTGSEKLLGCITNGSGIAFATAAYAPIDNKLVANELAYDERTGLTVGYRATVNSADDGYIGNFFCFIDAKVANVPGLVRIVSSATA